MAAKDEERSNRRAQVLSLVRNAEGPVSLVQVAEALSIHVNTARFHMNTLVANGQVEVAPSVPGAAGRPARLYRALPGMDPRGPRHYRALAEVLATVLPAGPDTRRRALEAGRRWGSARAVEPPQDLESPLDLEAPQNVEASHDAGCDNPVARLVRMLDGMGFAPERHGADAGGAVGDAGQIRLRNCPFAELAAERADLVCPIHLGMMRGAMETWGADETVESLVPFAEPDMCVAQLAPAGRG